MALYDPSVAPQSASLPEASPSWGLTHAFKSEVVEANVPPVYRDPEGHWFGLTRRARLFVVSAKRVDSATIAYEDLVQPRWKGKTCVRSGKHAYNVTLIASKLAHHGPKEYPVNEAAPAPSVMETWPPLKPDSLPLHKTGELRQDALRLVESIGFDRGPNGPPLR